MNQIAFKLLKLLNYLINIKQIKSDFPLNLVLLSFSHLKIRTACSVC